MPLIIPPRFKKEQIPYSVTILTDNPVAYWRLGESSINDPVFDEILGNHGVYVNGPTVGLPGLIGSDINTSVGFIVANQYATGSGNILPNNADNFSIECWVRIDGDTGSGQTLYTEELDGSNVALTLTYKPLTGKFTFNKYPPVDAEFGSLTTVAYGTVYHLVYVETATTRTFYINGVLDNTDNLPENYTGSAASNWVIGSSRIFSSYAFAGMDEVAIYNYSLSSSQVLAHYNAGTV